jgi:mono/diheme cytochrome c family protein
MDAGCVLARPGLRLAVGVGVLLAAGCRETPRPAAQAAPPAAAGLTRTERLLLAAASIALPPEGIAPGDLPDPRSRGAQLVVAYCAQCHALPTPLAHSATDWPGVVRRMWLRMEWLPESLRVLVPTPPERYEILRYLTGNALKVSGAVLPPGRGRDAFALVCSRCHALPDVRVHSPADWGIVYARMERNMERMKVPPPAAGQGEEILYYLQTVVGKERSAKPTPRRGEQGLE